MASYTEVYTNVTHNNVIAQLGINNISQQAYK